MLARTFASRLLQTAGPAGRHFITATSTTLSPTLQRPAGAIRSFHPGLKKEGEMSASAPAEQSRRRFAPVGRRTGGVNDGGVQQLKGIVFDMDGTLCEPQNHMFGEMRAALAIDAQTDILDHIYALPTAEQQDAAHEKIQAVERRAMREQVPREGLVELMQFLDRNGVRKAICTRNFETPVTHLINIHLPPPLHPFSPIITRAFRPPKPSPEGILHIAREWGVSVSEASESTHNESPEDESAIESSPTPSPPPQIPLIMVGDSVDDMAAGHAAGALTVLVRTEGKEALERDGRTDVVVRELGELVGLLEGGIGGR